MKIIFSTLFFLSIINYGCSQEQVLETKIGTNKVVCLFNFLETSSEKSRTSKSFSNYILGQLGEDNEFIRIIDEYTRLNLSYSNAKAEYPDKRIMFFDTKYLLWNAASNATSINDFSERIIGILPHYRHNVFIKSFRQIEPYYDRLIWNKEQGNIHHLEKKLADYKKKLSSLYINVSHFYGTPWNLDIPFRIIPYPIPLEKGSTYAIPRGNALICGFLSHNEDDYKNQLGIIIHEMCHILYDEQTPERQHQIDEWFSKSNSPYAALAYKFIDEAIASAIGNGWAYEKIHGEMDTSPWYTNKYVDKFSHTIFPLAKEYLESKKSIDKEFVDKSIQLFEDAFPNVHNETKLLMSEIQLYSNTSNIDEKNQISKSIRKIFSISSMWTYIPMDSDESKKSLNRKATTKVFVVNSNKDLNIIESLDKSFATLNIKTAVNSIDILKDEQSRSPIIIIHVDDIAKIDSAFEKVLNIEYLTFGQNYKI